ncbi:MAG: lytic transglycosylase domain-containing protein [Cellulosilyticaceae bacterium]
MNILKILKGILYIIAVILIAIPLVYWSYPTPHEEWVNAQSKQHSVDPLLIYAMMKVESGFDEEALSRSGAKGLMQIMDRTGIWGAQECGLGSFSAQQLFDPEVNIRIGVWYIARLIKQYAGDVNMALTAYNAGSGNVAKWRSNSAYSTDGTNLHTTPFKETAQYVKKVNFHYNMYQLLYRY